jgi:FMN-dependent NADH-azoreductase
MTLFRIDASIRSEGSISRAVADSVQAAWQAEHPGVEVVRRDLGQDPISPRSWMAAVAALSIPAEHWTAEQAEATQLAQTLRDEVLAAESLLIATPLYNYGVPAHLKTWFDLLLTTPELGAGGPQPLRGRPAVLAVARGGGYGAGTPREGWDHSTPWIERMLVDIYGLDVRTVAAELTLADVVPAMADLRDLAAQSLTEAHSTATGHGRHLAGALEQPVA